MEALETVLFWSFIMLCSVALGRYQAGLPALPPIRRRRRR